MSVRAVEVVERENIRRDIDKCITSILIPQDIVRVLIAGTDLDRKQILIDELKDAIKRLEALK